MEETSGAEDAKFEALFDDHPDSIVEIGTDGRYRRINRATTTLLGYEADEMVGRMPIDFTAPDYRSVAQQNVRRAAEGDVVEFRGRYRRRNGSAVDIVGRTIPIRSGGCLHGFFAVSRDATHDLDLSLALDAHAERLDALARLATSAPEAVERRAEATLGLLAHHVGAATGALITRARVTPVVRYRVDVAPARAPVALDLALLDAHFEGTPFTVTTAAKDGIAYVMLPVTIETQRLGLAVFAGPAVRPLSSADISLLRLAGGVLAGALRAFVAQPLEALYDPLTGAYGRSLLFDRIDAAIAMWRRYKHGCALHVLDLAGWPGYVAQHGQAASDDTLRTLGTRLRGLIRETDTLARIGRGRFAVLQSVADEAIGVESFGARLRDALARTAPLPGRYGVARCPEDGEEPRALLTAAETRSRQAP